VAAIDPENPLLIPPFSADNPLSTVEVDVTFTPSRNDDFVDALVLRPGGLAADQRVTVVLTGSSLGPPQIEVSAQQLTYGDRGTAALLVGSVDFQQVTVRNNGQSALTISPNIGGGSAAGEFTVMPAFVPPIAAGGAIILSVFFNPSEASDPASTFSPARPFEAFLNITSTTPTPRLTCSRRWPSLVGPVQACRIRRSRSRWSSATPTTHGRVLTFATSTSPSKTCRTA
jgi:hypothetical protein